ncbi:MAG: cysteine desulfurase-like protein [Chloroflexota bacterium]
MTLDVAALRAQFPSLASGIAHFDGPGGTQTPAIVGQAIAATLTGPLSNRGTGSLSERNAEEAIQAFRLAYADLLQVPPNGIVYGRSATQITYDFSHHLSKAWRAGDEVVVSQLDHDANVRPWIQAAERVGATVRWLQLNPETSELDLSDLDSVITERCRLVAVTGASNLLGTRPPVRRIADRAHAVGALAYVDGVHYTPHTTVDVGALGADLFVCSPYKFFGPHCAVLAAQPALLERIRPDKLLPSTDDVPERFEFGTLPYEIMAGATAAVDFIADLAPATTGDRRARLVAANHEIDAHEHRLLLAVEDAIESWGDRVTLHSRAADRTPTLFLTFRDKRSEDGYAYLAARDVLAPAASFYAHEAFARLGVSDSAGLRIGLAPYNDDQDVDRLVTALGDFLGE